MMVLCFQDLGKKEAEEQDRQFKNLMLDLDHNADQKIDFMEFIAFVASIGMISYEDKEWAGRPHPGVQPNGGNGSIQSL